MFFTYCDVLSYCSYCTIAINTVLHAHLVFLPLPFFACSGRGKGDAVINMSEQGQVCASRDVDDVGAGDQFGRSNRLVDAVEAAGVAIEADIEEASWGCCCNVQHGKPEDKDGAGYG